MGSLSCIRGILYLTFKREYKIILILWKGQQYKASTYEDVKVHI